MRATESARSNASRQTGFGSVGSSASCSPYQCFGRSGLDACGHGPTSVAGTRAGKPIGAAELADIPPVNRETATLLPCPCRARVVRHVARAVCPHHEVVLADDLAARGLARLLAIDVEESEHDALVPNGPVTPLRKRARAHRHGYELLPAVMTDDVPQLGITVDEVIERAHRGASDRRGQSRRGRPSSDRGPEPSDQVAEALTLRHEPSTWARWSSSG